MIDVISETEVVALIITHIFGNLILQVVRFLFQERKCALVLRRGSLLALTQICCDLGDDVITSLPQMWESVTKSLEQNQSMAYT